MPETVDAHGMGISIMHYRARLIGATLAIEPRDGRGTRVFCILKTPHLGEPERDAVWAFAKSFRG